MIKSTFNNLPEAKKKRVIEAITDEFASVDTNRVSINNIIEKAKISRGSFYQYFDDKMDLVEVVIRYYLKRFEEKITEVMRVSRGDLFYTFEQCLAILCGFGKNEKDKIIIRKFLVNIYAENTLVSEYISKRCSGFREIDELMEQLSRKNLKNQGDDFFKVLVNILITVLLHSLMDFFEKDKNYESVEVDFLKKVDIIKKGAVV